MPSLDPIDLQDFEEWNQRESRVNLDRAHKRAQEAIDLAIEEVIRQEDEKNGKFRSE